MGSKYVHQYIMIYSGARREQKASKGIEFYIHTRWGDRIKTIMCERKDDHNKNRT